MDRLHRELTSATRLEQDKRRDGLALPAALLALLLIATLIAGAFSATTEETRIGAAAEGRQTALVTAESAIEIAITGLASMADDPIGVGETRYHRVEGLGGPAGVHVTRLDSSRYWLVADAGSAAPNSGIARRIGVVVRATRGSGDSIAVDRIPERGWSELF